MFGYKAFFRIAILIGIGSASAQAAPVSAAPAANLSAVVQSNIQSCKVYELEAGKFKPAVDRSALSAGAPLTGRLHSARPDFFLTGIGGKTYAIPTSCLQTSTRASAGPASPRRASPRSAFIRQLEPRFRFLFYQDSPVVTDPTVGTYETIGHVSAVCPGFAYHRPINARFDFVADLCVIFGFADTRGVGSNELLDVTYESGHALTIGARFVPGVELPIAGRDFRVGLGVPFVFQTVAWGTTAAGATASSSGLKFPGLLLTLQGTRDKFGFIADFGFLKKTTRTMYSFGISYRL